MRAILYVDEQGTSITSPEEEYLYQQMELLKELGDIFSVMMFRQSPRELVTYPLSVDLYVVDFGGISTGYGATLGERYAEMLCRCIEKRPGTLFLIWSSITAKTVRYQMLKELEAQLGTEVDELPALPANVMFMPSYDDEVQETWDRVRTWLGVARKPTGPEIAERLEKLSQELDEASDLRIKAQATYEEVDDHPEPAEKEEVIPTPPPPPPVTRTEHEERRRRKREQRAKEREEDAKTPFPMLEQPIGWLTIPVYCNHYPEQTGGFKSFFKFEDTTSRVVAGYGDDEEELGTVAGCLGCIVEVRINSEPPEHRSYYLDPRDIWPGMVEIHEQFKQWKPGEAPPPTDLTNQKRVRDDPESDT